MEHPRAHLPRIPVAEMAWGPVVVLVLLAAALIALGMIGFRHRSVPVT